MSVEITDWDADLVRTYLRQDDEKLRSMVSGITPRAEIDGAGLLLRAAFVEAAYRRFEGGTRADVIRFVAHARIRRGRNAPPIDAAAAERLIVAALTGGRAEGLTELQRAQQVILLGELVEDEDLTEAELEAFLQTVRGHAERLAASLPGPPQAG